MAYVPTKGDTDYPGADGIKTAAQLGVVKFALANAGADVTGNDTAFTLDFKVLATKAGTYPVELNVLSAANTNATTLNCVGKNGAIVIAGSDVTTEATTQVTTEATTVTETTTKRSDVTTRQLQLQKLLLRDQVVVAVAVVAVVQATKLLQQLLL